MRKNKWNCLAMLFLFAFAGGNLWAQIPNGYYNNANNKTGDELKMALHDIIKGHHVVSYSGLLHAFAYTDCKPNGMIWDIYSNIEYSPSTGLCGEYEQEGDCWNREHTWPQSWFNESTTPRSDLFHVYPTDGYVNGQRGNYPYGEVNRPIYTSGNGSKLGSCVISGYSGRVFEPIDEYKGDIARSYFYMSVRYAGEDNEWGTSGMTNKSEILPWAMTMLLRWSDEDPVSQKEIDRNNAVYGYQNNRNPFIDHPEYARMIWDENWSGGISYSITCATGLQHGSVSAPESALEGSTVAITATPAPGYMVGTYTVYKTGSPSTTVPVSSNGTFTMPGYAVTVSATFVQNNTLYHITLGTVSHGSISASASTALSGTNITLTATPATGYSLYTWYVFKTGDMNYTVNTNGNSFVMPAFDVTVMATFVQGNTNGDYVKVTSAPEDWSGEYVLVYEQSNTTGYVWTGVDEANCYISKTITDNTIANADFVTVIIAPMTGGYSVKVNGGSNDGKYISGKSGENKLNFGTNPALNTLAFEFNSVMMTSNTSVMRFNSTSGQNRFRYFKSSTYTGQQPIQLYKKTANIPTPTHTIHFENNGGEGLMNDQIVNEFEPTALQTNTLTKTGFIFDGWNTEADGSGTYYSDGAMVTLLEDLVLYAQWEQLYIITLVAVENGSISASHSEAIQETTITLTATPEATFEFDHWSVTDAQGNAVTVNENQFEMPASDVTVSAVFVYVGQPFVREYYLVTSSEQLVAGRTYLIVNTSSGKALGTTQNNNNRSAAEVNISGNTIANINNTVCELTLGGQTGAWTFFDAQWNSTGGYLYAASSSANQLKTQATNDANGQWTVTIASNGSATIKAKGANTRNIIRYNPNSGNPIFSCYASGQQDVFLFIRSEEFDHIESETIANLFHFDKHIVRSGVTLTVTGTAVCNNASQLVIEDGAQLIHTSDNVQATVKKTIHAYSDNGGWYTMAVPFTSFNPAMGLTDAAFDLYAYDEAADLEWINYKADGFSLSAGQGYLYAHNPASTLRMSGTLNNGAYCQTVILNYVDGDTIKGFNLLGNPTAHEITFSKTEDVSDGHYYLDNDETWTYTTGNNVPMGRGFLVKANAENQAVTLNPQDGGGTAKNDAYLCLSVGNERVYVKMDEGISMPLLNSKVRHSSLYFTHDQQPYVMLVRNHASTIELSYEVKHDGKYTLTMDAYDLDLDYLHLLDKHTGLEVDLLASPSYTFEAKMGDDASRFQLIFKPIGK